MQKGARNPNHHLWKHQTIVTGKREKKKITLWVTEEDIEEVLNDLREIDSFSYSLKIGGEHKRK